MSPLFSNISYIITYREQNQERTQALLFNLPRLRLYFPNIEILLIEQDSESKLLLDKDLNIKHLFIYNPGLFNRSWSFNYAIKKTTKDVFIFADADVFLEKEGYIKCFNSINDFEAITPNKKEIINVSIDPEVSEPIQILNKRKLYTFAGGMLILTRNAYEKIGGWDERFEGWGGEDDAMSHVIYNLLSSKTFDLPHYHIDHPQSNISRNNQPKYESNKALLEEILTRNGFALKRYVEQLKKFDLGNPEKYSTAVSNEYSKSLRFVFAVTTFNRLDFLRKCVDSFLQTKNNDVSWQLIIADDNSTDGTKEYLQNLKENFNAIIIQNKGTGIHHQVNTIIKTLSDMSFDLCFKCDDDVQFLQKGWDELYWNTIQRTGYQHLIFFDKTWQPHANLSRPIQHGKLVSNCPPEKIQGAFYTITKEMIDSVGYFDEQQFGSSGFGHVDYSFRNCRAGFNVLANPFDVENSNQFIQLQNVNAYLSATTLKEKSLSNSKYVIAFKKQLLSMDRTYIPYNENLQLHTVLQAKSEFEATLSKKPPLRIYQKADATFYPERGISGFLGFVLKRIYNLSIDLKLYFIPAGIKLIGKTLNKVGIHLINIEQ